MKLYKYVVPDRTDILKNKIIRFSQPSALNDPFEMQPYFESIAKDSYFEERLDKEQMLEKALRDVYTGLPAELKNLLP